MSNYQRLISYIYTYEGGIKGKNIGFAKLETRGPQCRITVNVKKIFVGGNPIGVYLLSEKKEWRIGTLFVRNGAGEFRATVSSADVESSGLGIEAFYGLSVHDVESAWRSYTTIWEDAVSHAAEVELADVTAENARKKQTPEEVEQEIKLQNTLPISHEIEEALDQEPLKKPVQADAGQGEVVPVSQEAAGVTAKEEALPLIQGEGGQSSKSTGKEILGGAEGKNAAMADSTAEPSEQPLVIKELKNRHRDWSAAAVHNLRESLMRDQAAVSKSAEVSSAAVQVREESGYSDRLRSDGGCGLSGENPQRPHPVPLTPRPEEASRIPLASDVQSPQPEPQMSQAPPQTPQGPMSSQRSSASQPLQAPDNSNPEMSEAPGSERVIRMPQAPGADGRTPMGAPGRRPIPGPMPQNRMGGRPMSNRGPYQAPGTQEEAKLQEPGTGEAAKSQQPAAGEALPSDFIPTPQEEKETVTQSEMWEQLRKKYPKVLAFDYADGCEVLTIKPQDIGLLPRETWLFGNNSFLLHGYYNYRYLILARLNNPSGKPRFLLGVPGHYYSNEKYMAGMFGFPDFVLAKKQQPGDGRFGYWYTDVKMGD